jgi:hypothetical protein
MDQVVAQALAVFERMVGERRPNQASITAPNGVARSVAPTAAAVPDGPSTDSQPRRNGHAPADRLAESVPR